MRDAVPCPRGCAAPTSSARLLPRLSPDAPRVSGSPPGGTPPRDAPHLPCRAEAARGRAPRPTEAARRAHGVAEVPRAAQSTLPRPAQPRAAASPTGAGRGRGRSARRARVAAPPQRPRGTGRSVARPSAAIGRHAGRRRRAVMGPRRGRRPAWWAPRVRGRPCIGRHRHRCPGPRARGARSACRVSRRRRRRGHGRG